MDSCVWCWRTADTSVVEKHNLKGPAGDRLGRTGTTGRGIYMHCGWLHQDNETLEDRFVFRQGRSRETSMPGL